VGGGFLIVSVCSVLYNINLDIYFVNFFSYFVYHRAGSDHFWDGGWHHGAWLAPRRGAEEGDFGSGGVAALNHRLIAGIPPG
jgi:hypothetical protein